MQDGSVTKLFTEQLNYYSQNNHSSGTSPLVGLFSEWIKKQKINKHLSVAEFGGSAGQLLTAINNQYPKAALTNIEFVVGYKQKQVSKKIDFIHASILNSKIKNKSYDVLIIRDVLHHLIGNNLTQTRQNQSVALNELKRLVKPGGIILIEELTNKSSLMCRLIYIGSKLNSKIGVRIPSLEISPNTIIGLFTPGQLENLLVKTFKRKNLEQIYFKKASNNWKGKIIYLGTAYGKLIALIKG